MAQQTIINGIPHIKLSRFEWIDKETTGLAHPLGTVFLSKDKRLGFVANGYYWYMFSMKKI